MFILQNLYHRKWFKILFLMLYSFSFAYSSYS
jgi:hypothetical protein